MRKIRVLHCPAIVAGNAQQLARAERELGIESWVVALTGSPFGYGTDEILWERKDNVIMREIKRWRLLWRALKDFDIIHFNFGQSITPEWLPPHPTFREKHHLLSLSIYNFYARMLGLRDLLLLKKAGKGIVVTYQGDDARQGDFCQANFEISPATEVEPGYYSKKSDAHKRRKIAQFGKYADRIYALNPDLLHVLPVRSQFLPYSHIDLRDWKPINKPNPNPKEPVIVHAPSHQGVKGTPFVLEAISRLKSEGVALEFVQVEGVSHSKAREIYERADLLIDQLLCGWYGGLSVEFMALGKPVFCYLREGDLKYIPDQMREDLPIINATPTTIYHVLKEWLTERRHELTEIGQRSRTYVEKWHDPLKIAARLKADYESILSVDRRSSH